MSEEISFFNSSGIGKHRLDIQFNDTGLMKVIDLQRNTSANVYKAKSC